MSSVTFLHKLHELAARTSATPINPEDNEEYIVDDCVAFEMEALSDPQWIHFVSIRAVNAGKGDGSKALKKVMNLADSCGVYLIGKVIPYNTKDMPKDKLQAWYRKHGCKPFNENNPDGLWFRVPDGSKFRNPRLSLKDRIKVHKGFSGDDLKSHINFTAVLGFLFALWLLKKS